MVRFCDLKTGTEMVRGTASKTCKQQAVITPCTFWALMRMIMRCDEELASYRSGHLDRCWDRNLDGSRLVCCVRHEDGVADRQMDQLGNDLSIKAEGRIAEGICCWCNNSLSRR